MKSTIAGALLAVVVVGLAFYDVRRSGPTVFHGEIMDSRCAEMGSHEAVMKMQGFQTPLQCALFCAHYSNPLSVWVLHDPESKKIYQLSDQGKVQPFAAEKVTISGSYDDASKTILITAITASAP
jgi:hypothetical protein